MKNIIIKLDCITIVYHIWPLLTFDLYEGIVIISDLATKFGSQCMEHRLFYFTSVEL